MPSGALSFFFLAMRRGGRDSTAGPRIQDRDSVPVDPPPRGPIIGAHGVSRGLPLRRGLLWRVAPRRDHLRVPLLLGTPPSEPRSGGPEGQERGGVDQD